MVVNGDYGQERVDGSSLMGSTNNWACLVISVPMSMRSDPLGQERDRSDGGSEEKGVKAHLAKELPRLNP
jgi:hypothetical protein